MKNIHQIHREAVTLLKKAEEAEQDGDMGGHSLFLNQAFAKELEAAEALKDIHDAEPTRSILYRSAAVLAFRLKDFKQSQSLIQTAMTKQIFPEMKRELEDLALLAAKAESGIELEDGPGGNSAIVYRKFHPIDLEETLSFIAGVNKAVNAIKVTMGPWGRSVVIEQKSTSPLVTKDGFQIAKQIELSNNLENMGAQMVKEIAKKTVEIAGDGTTTAAVLTQAIMAASIRSMQSGVRYNGMKLGMEKAVEMVVKHLKLQSVLIKSDFKKVYDVAFTASNSDDAIANLITEGYKKVGTDGLVTIDESKSLQSYIELRKGLHFSQGYLSSEFVTDIEKMTVSFENAYLLICDKKITSLSEIKLFLEKAANKNRPLLIIAEDVTGEALTTLIVNKRGGIVKIAAVKRPNQGHHSREFLQDIAIFTGGTVISDHTGQSLESAGDGVLGEAGLITISKDSTVLMEGNGKAQDIKTRLDELTLLTSIAKDGEEKQQLLMQRAKLATGIATIYVGGATVMEIKEKKNRFEDAVLATRAAIDEGILPGGGSSLLKAGKALELANTASEDEYMGVNIIKNALSAPTRQILKNASLDYSGIIHQVYESEDQFGYNAVTGYVENMIEAGVIDSTKVIVTALTQAASICSNYIQSSFILSSESLKRKLQK